jgi:hypothetical protein
MQPFDRRDFIASLGGAAAVSLMSHEARADALEHALMGHTNGTALAMAAAAPAAAAGTATAKFPTVAELEAQIPDLPRRRGTGSILFAADTDGGKIPLLKKLPARPTIPDFFAARFDHTKNHCLQSASQALKKGADEEVVLACLLHDTVLEMIRSDHGWWSAQMFEPYVSARTTFAIRYHQALRFYPDDKAGYVYPEIYYNFFGVDYVPPPHIKAAYEYALKHKWYGAARELTVCDLYAFDKNAVVSIDPFIDIIGRHFRQPKEGLGNDGSPSAHMWRTLINPDAPL